MINAFYDRVERDDLLSPLFPGGVSREHRSHVTAWWIEVFGGPARYTSTWAATSGCSPTTATWASRSSSGGRFVSLMSVAADDAGLPADPEFRSALLAYLELGVAVRLRELPARRGAIAEHAPVPRWGWGGRPPYQALTARRGWRRRWPRGRRRPRRGRAATPGRSSRPPDLGDRARLGEGGEGQRAVGARQLVERGRLARAPGGPRRPGGGWGGGESRARAAGRPACRRRASPATRSGPSSTRPRSA